MNEEMRAKYNRGRRILTEVNIVLDNYQKLTFYLNGGNCEEESIEILTKQSVAMKNYIDILLERLSKTQY